MPDSLIDAVRRYLQQSEEASGMARHPMPGLTTIRSFEPSGLMHAITQPLVCLVLQGSKQVTMGTEIFAFGKGDSLLITADVPIVSQITQASADSPYLAVAVELDLSVIAELAVQMGAAPAADGAPLIVDPTETEVANAVLRLMGLLKRPASIPVLRTTMMRELHYWLLAGKHGAAIRRLGWPDGNSQRIAKAIAAIRGNFTITLPVENLAALAGMSPSSFHHHFRAVTSLSPLQFQKQLRLIEARRLMTAEGIAAGSAAFEVGYESVPQFTREYRRMFGLPPAQDRDAMRGRVTAEV